MGSTKGLSCTVGKQKLRQQDFKIAFGKIKSCHEFKSEAEWAILK